jgi:hypothetical protein
MNLVLNDDDPVAIRFVDDQIIGGSELDITDISLELSHQAGAPGDHARPAQFITDFVNDVVGNDIEEVFTIDKVSQCPSHKIKIGLGSLVGGIILA